MGRKEREKRSTPVLASNRAARHEFQLFERFEAGIVLTGPEVKSARQGALNLKDAHARVRHGEVFLHNLHISPYSHATRENPDQPDRPRKLLLNPREIRKLARATETTGMTIVPTRVYLKGGWIKVEVAVARGKKLHDKRDSKRRREAELEIARATARRR